MERITRPCLDLEWKSFEIAMNSLGLASSNAALTEQMFLRDKPGHRLFLLFQKFPVLASLWCLSIRQWRDHVAEVLQRAAKDRHALSRLDIQEPFHGAIKDIRLGLSDAHHGGRSVTLIEFNKGPRVIYKPRAGKSEAAWFSFLAWINRNGFRPKLRNPRLLPRKGYSWMEYMQAAPCQNKAGVRRFYERLGGLIAAAYLLKAVDCHRENLIAAGEHPVLVDIDALWHVSPTTKAQSMHEVLYRTGFFPNARRRSLQSRSSVLGHAQRGGHLPYIGDQSVPPGRHADAIVSGFRRAWRCVLGNAGRRAAFLRRLESMGTRERRWIYCSTAKYGAILRASLRPAVVRSAAQRDAVVCEFSTRSGVSKSVVRAEIKALRELNIPYFNRRTRGHMPPEPKQPPSELILAIRKAVEWAENTARPGTTLSKGDRYKSGNPRPAGPRPSHSALE
ncbi:MAG: type 2 lanthipeptide synthetase LanM [Verrucomicrobiota bacterium]|nr:type 2 lanthipeptide synthetase LanM [Verrucomicrobiota bacterium]